MACILLTIALGTVGYRVFLRLFEEQYKTITEQIAHTALSYVDGDSITRYVDEISKLSRPSEAQYFVVDDEWTETNRQLDELTKTTSLAYIYVTVPDKDYENRVYIYDTVHPLVMEANPKIKPYPLGKINSLKSYDEMRMNEIKSVMEKGECTIHFVYNDEAGGHVTTSIPVWDSQKKVVGMLSIVKPMSELKAFKQRYIHITSLISAVFTLVFISLFILFLIKRLIHPIMLVTSETSEFSNHKGELTGVLKKIKGKNELAVLARAIEKMIDDIHRYIDELTHATAEKERLSAELDVATQIQSNMLPRIFPPYHDHPEIELFASMKPAKEVGGDLYDFFFVDDDHFAVLVGDVSGKGVPAALFMTIAKTLLKNVGLSTHDPAEIFQHVNDQLCEGNDAGLFVTCWLGIITLSSGKMEFANAGHTSPLVYHKGKIEYLNVQPNLMLGALPGMKYDTHEFTLDRGDRLFIYTDGVTEATNADNELYGEERLLSAITGLQNLSSKEMLKGIEDSVKAFVGDAPQFDDITMLELSLKDVREQNTTDETGKDAEMNGIHTENQTRTFAATDENMEAVNEFIHGILPENTSFGTINQIDLAVEELYVNIAHYAYAPDTGDVEIGLSLDDNDGKKVLGITFKDYGKPFDPLAKKDPDITLSAEERDIGGLGIFLTKKFMDTVVYENRDGANILTITKTLVLDDGED